VTLRLALGASARLGAVVGAGHLGALLLAGALLPPLPIACAAAALGASWLHVWRSHVRRSGAGAVTELALAAGVPTWVHRDGRTGGGAILSRFVAPGLVVLTVRATGRRRVLPIVIAGDAVGAQAHRRLRTHLRWALADPDDPGGI
jgi:hypothetical protein